jgi:hypothetical protein
MWHLGHSAGTQGMTGEESPADFAARIIPELRVGGYPNLAEHAERHMAAPSGDTAREFEFGLDLILNGLDRARATA